MRKLLTLIIIIFSIGATNIPVSREWQKAGFGGGGTYPMITPDNTVPGLLYMASDVAGNFKSVNAGEQWEFMNVGTTTILNTAIVQSVSDPNVLYSIGRKLIKSVNGGRSWDTLGNYSTNRPNSYKCIVVDRTNADIFYFATTNGKIYKSTDGGINIVEYATPFGTNIPAEFLYLNTDGSRLVAGSNGSGMVSYNTTTDTPTDIDLPDTNGLRNTDFGTYDNSGTEVFCTTSGLHINCTEDFATWTPTTDVTADTAYFIRRFAVKKVSGGARTFVTWTRLMSSQYTSFVSQSMNSGSSWTDVSTNVTMDVVNNPTEIWASFGSIGTVFSIAFDPHSDTQAWMTTDWRIFRSNDGGVNWVEKVKGAQNIVNSDLACSPTNRCFMASMDVGLQYSDDLGDHWTAAFPNTSNGAEQGFSKAGHVWRVLTRGSLAEWQAGTGQVVATTSNWADFKPRVIYSNDNGVTWTITTSGLPTTQLNSTTGLTDPNKAAWGVGHPRALAKCSSNDDILALGIDGYSATENGGIFISTNGGVDWTRTTQPPQWKTYNAIAFDPTDATCNTIEFAEWFASTGSISKTWRTIDRGSTWTNVKNVIGIYDLAYGSNGTAYQVGLDTNPNIDRSTNGTTWSLMKALNLTNQIADGLVVDANNPNRICVGVNDGTNTGTSQGSGSDASGDGAGSIYCTADAQNGSSAIWHHITGDLPSPSGVTVITFAYNYQGSDWILIGTDGSGVFRLPAKDKSRTTISNVRFLNP